MLNRRHIRVKVLQSLYAYYQSKNDDLASGEKELLYGLEKIYDMYLYQLLLLGMLSEEEEKIIEENLSKKLPTHDDLNPKRRFAQNACMKMLASDEQLQKAARNRKVSWQNEKALLRKLMMHIRDQEYYVDYINADSDDYAADTKFVVKVLNNGVIPFEQLHSFYEENSIYWLVDWELVNKMVVKTLKSSKDSDGSLNLLDLYKDPSDREFARELFKRTIINHAEFDEIISAKTKNWDAERIALMDMIIMEMALAEILKFPEIPVKVSLNEYIELSKMYSTPKSKIFVNGVLDKLVEELTADNKVKKITKS